jgi:pimeloyl-ACP methyl ester carboxylesterase
MTGPASHGLAVDEAGPSDGPRVVLVHGSMDRMTGFAKVVRVLAGRCRVVRYDRRGYARSVGHPGPFEIEHHVDDLVAIVGDQPSVVVGHSFGGNVALAAAQRHAAIRAVGIYESPLSWLAWWPGGSAGTAALAAPDPHEAADVFMRRLAGEARWEGLPEGVRAARRAEGRVLVAELSSLRRRAPWDPDLIAVPVVVGRGSRASEHQARGTEYAASVIPGAHLITIEGAGHLAMATHPGEFVSQLVDPVVAHLGPSLNPE